MNSPNLLQSAIARYNEENDRRLEYRADLPLIGAGSAIDSLGLVQLIVIIEEEVEDRTGKLISLVNEKAMSLKNSPFRTAASLEAYLETLINGGE